MTETPLHPPAHPATYDVFYLLCPSYSPSSPPAPSSLCVGGYSPLLFPSSSISLSFAPAALPCIIKFLVEVHPPTLPPAFSVFLHFSPPRSVFLSCYQETQKGKASLGKLGLFFILWSPSFPYLPLSSGLQCQACLVK